MFSKPNFEYSVKIEASAEYKQLSSYYSHKMIEVNQTLLDWQKQIVARWLLDQLKAGNWKNPNVSTVLLVAHEANETLEREKADNLRYYCQFASPEFLAQIRSELESKLNTYLSRLKENKHEVPQALNEKKTGLLTVSQLSKIIVSLYDRMQKVLQAEGLVSNVSRDSKSERKLSV